LVLVPHSDATAIVLPGTTGGAASAEPGAAGSGQLDDLADLADLADDADDDADDDAEADADAESGSDLSGGGGGVSGNGAGDTDEPAERAADIPEVVAVAVPAVPAVPAAAAAASRRVSELAERPVSRRATEPVFSRRTSERVPTPRALAAPVALAAPAAEQQPAPEQQPGVLPLAQPVAEPVAEVAPVVAATVAVAVAAAAVATPEAAAPAAPLTRQEQEQIALEYVDYNCARLAAQGVPANIVSVAYYNLRAGVEAAANGGRRPRDEVMLESLVTVPDEKLAGTPRAFNEACDNLAQQFGVDVVEAERVLLTKITGMTYFLQQPEVVVVAGLVKARMPWQQWKTVVQESLRHVRKQRKSTWLTSTADDVRYAVTSMPPETLQRLVQAIRDTGATEASCAREDIDVMQPFAPGGLVVQQRRARRA
jgi:hypothetical protein